MVVMMVLFLFPSVSGASEQVFSNYSDSLVSLKVMGESSIKGSGFIYGPEGYILTNNHVVSEDGSEQEMEIRFNRTAEWTKVRMVGRDPGTDLAVLKANLPYGVESLNISESTVTKGQRVVLVGNPFAVETVLVSGEILEISETVTTREGVRLEDSVVISAEVKPGSSGGPVINQKGEVVGVISARDRDDKRGFAIPTSTLRTVIPRIIQNQTVKPTISSKE